MGYRPTWAEIDLGALKFNFNSVRDKIKKGIRVMVVVKANAYGHGIVAVSRTLEREGVDYLGVATTDEALTLRSSGVKSPILVLGAVLPEEAPVAVRNDITLTLCSDDLAKALIREAKRLNKPAKVHIKIDTGMGRIGVWHESAPSFIENIFKTKELFPEGIYTHFSSAGRDDFFTQYQIDSFDGLLKKMSQKNINFKLRHAANSIALISVLKSHLNLIRPGIIMYGIYPKKGASKLIRLKPVMSLKTRVTFLKDVPAGRSISYGRTYITQKDTKIATLPIGYADGYGRILSNKAQAIVRGKRAPVIGKITMDQTMLDVGHIQNVKTGDEVVLIGSQRGELITADELAKLCGTIPYEIVTGISDRVPRVYKE